MATVTINDAYLNSIARAIRTKNGSTESYKPKEMASAILNLNTNSGSEEGDGGETITVAGSTILVPYGTVTIDDEAYANDNTISCVFIPKSVQEVCDNAFANCENLNTVIFEQGEHWDLVYTDDGYPVHSNAFFNCPLSQIVFLDGHCCINLFTNSPWGSSNRTPQFIYYNTD